MKKLIIRLLLSKKEREIISRALYFSKYKYRQRDKQEEYEEVKEVCSKKYFGEINQIDEVNFI